MPVALAAETVSSLALLALSLFVLGGGAILAYFLGRAQPQVIRVVFPLVAFATLGAFAMLVFVARLTR